VIGLANYPLVGFAVLLVALWISARGGVRFASRTEPIREDFNIVVTATLTLLGLLIGFTLSMAVSRYDQRKIYEEEEANDIGTEYLRTQLLPDPTGENIRKLLRDYLDQRILSYSTRQSDKLAEIDASTSGLQTKLWEGVREYALRNPSVLTALATSGMNDVINAQGYAEAAWLNRIPRAVWVLLTLISFFANVMVGLSLRKSRSRGLLIAVLPFIISIALLLISDIDSPRGGLIHVRPVNLEKLAKSLRS
jgi:hypothetical protein